MSFMVFDALLYSGKPALPGMTVMSQLVGLTSPPPAGSDGYFYIDYEPAIGTLTEVQAAVAAAAPVLASYQASNPGANFGFYALGPVLDYYGIINPSVNEPPNTPLAARNTATEPLNAACNYVLPSLYNLVGPDDPLWQTYAAGTIAEARRVSAGRPVYAFVWPQYSFGGNAYIDTPTWTAQLEWVQANCDGIVLWGGYEQAWNPGAPWWLAAESVLGIGCPPSTNYRNQIMPGPTTSTALDLIIGGLRNINALEAGETPQGNDASDALQVLNDMLDSLSTEKLFIYSPTENILSWTPGQFAYTIGNPTQGTFTGYTVSGSTLITGITNPSGLTITFGVGAGNVTVGGTLTDVQSAIPAGTTIVSLNTGAVTNITFTVAPTGTGGTFTSWAGGAVTGLIIFSDNETRTATVTVGGIAIWSPALTGTPTTSAQINTTTITMSQVANQTQISADSITYTAPGNFAIQRPLRIRQGFTRITSSGNLGLDYYFDCQNSIDNYNQIGYKGVSGPWPKYAAYQPLMPYGSLRIYPNPSQAGEVHLWTDLILQNFLTVNQTFSLPQGYSRVLKKLLAIELAPEYGKNPSAELLRQAWQAKNDLKTLNETPAVQMNYDSALNFPSGRDAGWIYHGGFI